MGVMMLGLCIRHSFIGHERLACLLEGNAWIVKDVSLSVEDSNG